MQLVCSHCEKLFVYSAETHGPAPVQQRLLGNATKTAEESLALNTASTQQVSAALGHSVVDISYPGSFVMVRSPFLEFLVGVKKKLLGRLGTPAVNLWTDSEDDTKLRRAVSRHKYDVLIEHAQQWAASCEACRAFLQIASSCRWYLDPLTDLTALGLNKNNLTRNQHEDEEDYNARVSSLQLRLSSLCLPASNPMSIVILQHAFYKTCILGMCAAGNNYEEYAILLGKIGLIPFPKSNKLSQILEHVHEQLVSVNHTKYKRPLQSVVTTYGWNTALIVYNVGTIDFTKNLCDKITNMWYSASRPPGTPVDVIDCSVFGRDATSDLPGLFCLHKNMKDLTKVTELIQKELTKESSVMYVNPELTRSDPTLVTVM